MGPRFLPRRGDGLMFKPNRKIARPPVALSRELWHVPKSSNST